MPGELVISASDPIEGSWNGFRIEVAQEKDFPAMLDHLFQEYCKDEPITKFNKHSKSICDGMVEYGRLGLLSGGLHSLVAFDEATGEVAGIRISRLLTKDEAEKAHEKSDKYYGDFEVVFRLLGQLDQMVQPPGTLFDKYNVDKIYEYRILSVGTKYRQRGLALEMCLRSLRLGKREGCGLAMVYFTGNFSRRVGNKLGFYLESEIKYSEYKEDGKLMFTDMGVHESVSLMTKAL